MHLLRERRQMDANWGIKASCGGALRGTQMRALRNQEQKHAISYASTEQEAMTLTTGSCTYLELQRPRPATDGTYEGNTTIKDGGQRISNDCR